MSPALGDVTPLAERFQQHVEHRGPDECWPWTGVKTRGGYGRIRAGGSAPLVSAPRVAWELHYGRSFPEGLQVDHLCRNPTCVNPTHLEPVTAQENVRRGSNTKLTMEKAEEIRASSESGPVLAARYGVSRALISMVRTGRMWKADEAA